MQVKNMLATGLLSAMLSSNLLFSQETRHENLGPNINSSAGELTFLIAASGKLAYWVRDKHAQNLSTQERSSSLAKEL